MADKHLLLQDENDIEPLIEKEDFNVKRKSIFERKVFKYLFCCCYNNYDLEIYERNNIKELVKEVGDYYDEENPQHNKVLIEIEEILLEKLSNKENIWKDVGFQTNNPTTDIRGGGLLSLKFLLFYLKNYTDEFLANSKIDYLLMSVLVINISVST
jgi:hypothetical protein